MTESNELTRPIIGIENRSAQEVFDIMCDRISAASKVRAIREGDGEIVATMHRSDDGRETLFSKGNVPNLLGFTSTPLYASPIPATGGEKE